MNEKIAIRNLVARDCFIIAEAFNAQGWKKPKEQFEKYLVDQNKNEREVLIAEMNGVFAGYLTIIWDSCYTPFKEEGIPEIVDFNVLVKFQGKGIGSQLMDEAEKKISKVSDQVGIGVGLTADYGKAQRLYVSRGYIPDGRGLSQNGTFLKHGDKVMVDDGLVICFTKRFSGRNKKADTP